MDTNAGEFVEEKRAEAWMQRIEIGEVVKIKGEELEVVRIEKREITLKLLGQIERIHRADGFAEVADAESKRQREKMLKRQVEKRPTTGGTDEGTHRRTISDQGVGRRG